MDISNIQPPLDLRETYRPEEEPAKEKDLAKQQRLIGSMAHLALQSVENFTTLYLKLNDLVLSIIGVAETSNPDYLGPTDTKH